MMQEHPPLAGLSVPLEASLEAVILIDEDDRIVYANPAACQITGYSLEELLGTDAYGSMPADARAALQEAIKQHEATQPPGSIMRGGFVMTRANGETYEAEFTAALLMVDGRCLVAVMFHDVTEMQRMARKVEALSEIASQVAFAESLEPTLSKLAKSVVRATGTAACCVFLVDERGELRLTTDGRFIWGSYGLPQDPEAEALWREARRRGAKPNIDAVRERRPLIHTGTRVQLLSDPAFEPVYPYLREAPWDSIVSLPMIYRNDAIGALNVFYPRGKSPSQLEIAFLGAIAGHAAVAVENSRLITEAKEKAILEERQRLARELHDSVSQALYGIALGARTARTLLDQDPAQAAEPLDYVLSLADAGLAEMRALIFELRPETLETEGLIAALTKQIDSVRARHGLDIHADLGEEPELPYEIKETAYRIAQEALNNVVRHARARRVDLRVHNGGDELVLEIGDDGVGFSSDDAPGHLGLRSMRERAARVGGRLEVESILNQGTRITASIPRSPETGA
jgi:PAS domain S-box-containing protein